MKFYYNLKVCAIILSLILFSGCTKATDGMVMEEVITIPVIVLQVNPSSIKNELTFAGQIKPNESVSVVGKMAGKVETVSYDIGDRVSMGAVLYTLDKKDVENQIAQLNASLNAASVGVSSAQTGLQQATSGGQIQSNITQLETAIENSTQSVAAAEKNMEAAQLAIDTAQLAIDTSQLAIENAKVTIENTQLQIDDLTKSYEDTKILFDAGIATQAQMDTIKLNLEKAEAAKQQAQLQLEQAEIQRNQAEVQRNQAEVQRDQVEIQYNQSLIAQKQALEAYDITTQKIIDDNRENAANGVNSAIAQRDTVAVQLEIAKSTLNDLSVTSPISGIVTAKNVIAGGMSSMSIPSYVIENIDIVTVDVKVSEMIINKLTIGQDVNVSIKSLGNSVIVGKIKSIIPSADATNMYPIKIEIDNSDGLLKPGMFAQVSFIKEMSEDTVIVPRDTVMQDENGSFIYINSDGFAKRVSIDTGIDNGREIEIVNGVNFGDEVIITGQTNLIDGSKLNIIQNTDSHTSMQKINLEAANSLQ